MNCIILALILSNLSACFSLKIENLSGIWSLNSGDGKFQNLGAKVPGGIYSDLMENRLIKDPIYDENDQETKWIGRTDWTYSRNFTVDFELLNYSNINIVFEGLDTISSIFLNGQFMGNTSNMFVQYIFNVRNKIKVGTNYIEIRFRAPVEVAESLAKKQDELYPVPPQCPPAKYRGECHINQLRKMQASFSWDWGPTLASSGIWKNVHLEAFNSSIIRYTLVEIVENSPESIWNVSVRTYLSGNSLEKITGKLILSLETDYQTNLTIVTNVKNVKMNDLGEFEILQELRVPQSYVRRWWPNGYGEQNLYNLTVIFVSEGEMHTKSQKIGFRTIDLVQESLNQSTEGNIGYSFYFKVNNVPIFAKGSNAIPLNILPEKCSLEPSINELLETARNSHMNMLRVWGGGIYEFDYYYQRADELGIMIWQDFMFACALYPVTETFLNNVKAEVRHQVRRLGSHPSIVIWAGNNENEAAITGNWYGSMGKERYNEDYKKLYFETIKPEFRKILKNGIFIGSSPTNGRKSEEDGGISENPYDLHYGDVHTYIYALNSFNANIYPIPRFSSEYGFQSYPAFSTLEKSTGNVTNLVIGSDFLQHRQHHPLGDTELKLLISYQLNLPSKSSANYTNVFIFYSQIIQAVAIKTETEHYRRYRSILTDDGKGLTMGALYWQLNDVWIAPSWSGIDATGKWKMLQYYVRNVFEPIIIVGHLNNERTLEISVVSDKLITIEDAVLSVAVYNWRSFTPVVIKKYNITIEANSSKDVVKLETDDYLQEFNCGSLTQARRNCFFRLTLSRDNNSVAPENFVIPDSLKNLNLEIPDLKVFSVEKLTNTDEKNFKITIKSTKIALFVWIDSRDIPGLFSENGFHIVNETKSVYFQSKTSITTDDLKKNLVLSDIFKVNRT